MAGDAVVGIVDDVVEDVVNEGPEVAKLVVDSEIDAIDDAVDEMVAAVLEKKLGLKFVGGVGQTEVFDKDAFVAADVTADVIDGFDASD